MSNKGLMKKVSLMRLFLKESAIDCRMANGMMILDMFLRQLRQHFKPFPRL